MAQAAQWQVLNTRHLEIYYLDIEDLKGFDKKIVFRMDSSRFTNFSGGSPGPEPGFEKNLASKVDALFERVQSILDMREPLKIKIRIYPNKALLNDAYFQIYKKRKQLRAWYIFKHNTVYVNARDIFSGMLAHEIAHGIIDNFLTVKPPRATAEILARYVDKHLHETSKDLVMTSP
ncbi:MAG: hypothetical protein JEZ12_05220 [Desulfobacterium sp.]|nr:hypothetical protein [Desulfobacterium sp.]